MHVQRRRVLAAGGAASVAALAACAPTRTFLTAPASAAVPHQPLVGARWHYQRVNLYNDLVLDERLCELVQTDPAIVVAWRDGQGNEIARERYTRTWDVVDEPHFDAPLRFDTPVPVVPNPLVAGTRQQAVSSYRVRGSSQALPWRSVVQARGWERLTVPAGEFVALRIERVSYFEPWQLGRFNARREETLWFAPEIGRWVRRDWTGYFRDESTLGGSGRLARVSPEEREDAISWRLLGYEAAPTS